MTTLAQRWLADESARFPLDGRTRVALLYPNRYAVALSSLGYQALWKGFDALEDLSVERVVQMGEGPEGRSLETGRRLADFDLVAVSISDELDLPHLIEMLTAGGLPALRDERDDDAPPVIAGGPLALSNPRPLGPFVDAVFRGDSEGLLAPIARALNDAPARVAFPAAITDLEGVWLPSRDGDTLPPSRRVDPAELPASGRIWTPHAALADMFLVEVSRGCPRQCDFCLGRRQNWPERRADRERIWEAIPAAAPRVGFVGSAVTDHPDLVTLLDRAVTRGQGVGLSSARADRLDDDLVRLLVAGGMRTMTIASDATSERLRGAIHKGIREAHLIRAAELARDHGVRNLKLYVIVGLPGETDTDIEECVALCERLRRLGRLSVSVNPFVPKLGTPLADETMPPVREIERRLKRLRKGLAPQGVALSGLSARWAWVQWRLSVGGQKTGLAALAATRSGGRFADWKKALGH